MIVKVVSLVLIMPSDDDIKIAIRVLQYFGSKVIGLSNLEVLDNLYSFIHSPLKTNRTTYTK